MGGQRAGRQIPDVEGGGGGAVGHWDRSGEGSGIRGGSSEFRGRPIARLNRIGNLRASVEEFLEFARRGSANGTPLEVVPGGPWAAGNLWPLVIWRVPPVGHLTDLPWNPRPPVAIPGELEGIPGEVSGWNGSELNSERIHVRFSRNRRWNSGGWHRPGEAESGGFSRCRGPPDFFRAAARGTGEPGLHQAHTRRTPG